MSGEDKYATNAEGREHSENLRDTGPANEDIPVEITGPETNNQPLQPSNMDIHAHELHKMPGHGWKHYFFEFFMLFLAVFCGFLAENWREHIVDRHKEKEYMVSMINDLDKDMLQLKNANAFQEKILAATDTTLLLLNLQNMNDSVVKEIYRHDNLVFRFVTIELNEGTAAQLKNAGGMRLILNKTVLDSLSNYWYSQKSLYAIRDNLQLQKIKTHDIGLRILSQKYFSPSEKPLESIVTGNPRFITGSDLLLPEYANRIALCVEITKNYIRFIKREAAIAEQLKILIKKEYHLE